jgi:hypothetical protein
LKNNKAPGSDKLINEFIKNSPPFLVSIYTKLFNVVLDTGIIPETWTTGIIIPVYKNKGCNTRFNTLVHIKYYFKTLSFNITKLKLFPQVRSTDRIKSLPKVYEGTK